MILILTFSEKYDQCVDPIIDWLLYKEAKFLRISLNEIVSSHEFIIDIDNEKIFFKGIDLTKEVKVVYFRRFWEPINFKGNSKFWEQAKLEYKRELDEMIDIIFYFLRKKKWFPFYENILINKIKVLSLAKKNGIDVPSSIITNQFDEAKKFISQGKTIVKPISGSGYFIDNEKVYASYTSSVDEEFINRNKKFGVTLFQRKIDYEYEIRTFYLDGKFFSSVMIVDQEYDDVKQNIGTDKITWAKYEIPKYFTKKLHTLLKSIRLNTASLDIMKKNNGEYSLIEINPVGQFLAPSKICNYNIEKLIAEWLIKKMQ